ncbi:hypothetical protein NMY22_g9487 [Coprinellus aureogranulatus]|nr:hypothetical protein NMY22_g9487 [Coprinellus aureogranulatus]
MPICLYIPEVLLSICDKLDQKSCLSVALSCRGFLEPALDKLWQDITSFEPLFSCLPSDATVSYIKVTPDPAPGIFVLPAPGFRREHMQRYLEAYAHRIRSFTLPTIHARKQSPSTELLMALLFVTDHAHGALSPRLRKLVWESPLMSDRAPRSNLSGFISLFAGGHVESFRFPALPDNALYTCSIQAVTKRISHHLKTLEIAEMYEPETIDSYITQSRWDALETLILDGLSQTMLGYVAALPRLIRLTIRDLDETHPTLRIGKHSIQPRPADFASLRSLSLIFERARQECCNILEYLHPENQLESVEISCQFIGDSVVCQGIIDTIHRQCNPAALRSVRLVDWEVNPDIKKPPELGQFDIVDEEDPVDISPLQAFTNLEYLTVSWFPDVRMKRQYAREIVHTWPRLRHLDVCPPYRVRGGVPPFDHTDIINIANGCPSLNYLGLRFDTTQLTSQEISSQTPHRALRTLRVGESPITSPSRVLAFLNQNFPRLRTLDVWYDGVIVGKSALLNERWDYVVQKLGYGDR